MGPQHGFGIARRIEQVSEGILDLNEGNGIYRAPHTTAAGLDHLTMGNQREQPARAFLLHDKAGRETTRAGNRELGSRRHGAGAETREAGVTR